MKITDYLKKQVIREATHLKEVATPEELGNLRHSLVRPYSPSSCIYGLMTGNCNNERSNFLMNACIVPYSETLNEFKDPHSSTFPPRTGLRAKSLYSPIECYLASAYMFEERIYNLILFLKGEKENLTPEEL